MGGGASCDAGRYGRLELTLNSTTSSRCQSGVSCGQARTLGKAFAPACGN